MEGIHHSFKADLCMECFDPSWLIKHHMQWRVFPTETSEDPKWKLFPRWLRKKQTNQWKSKKSMQSEFPMLPIPNARTCAFDFILWQSKRNQSTGDTMILIPPTRGIKYEYIVVRYKKLKKKTHRSKQKHGLYRYIKHLLKSFPKPSSYVANVKTSGSLSWGDSDGTFFGLAFVDMKAHPYPHHLYPPTRHATVDGWNLGSTHQLRLVVGS